MSNFGTNTIWVLAPKNNSQTAKTKSKLPKNWAKFEFLQGFNPKKQESNKKLQKNWISFKNNISFGKDNCFCQLPQVLPNLAKMPILVLNQ